MSNKYEQLMAESAFGLARTVAELRAEHEVVLPWARWAYEVLDRLQAAGVIDEAILLSSVPDVVKE